MFKGCISLEDQAKQIFGPGGPMIGQIILSPLWAISLQMSAFDPKRTCACAVQMSASGDEAAHVCLWE
jgi:hypothetical protein